METTQERLKKHGKTVTEHQEEGNITNNGGPIKNQACLPPAGTEHGL